MRNEYNIAKAELRHHMQDSSIFPLAPDERKLLISVACDSIRHGIIHREPLQVDPVSFSPPLREQKATFVTLKHGEDLRGCIGVIRAIRPLIEDVAENAFAAAFHDPRFGSLGQSELKGLSIHISVLSPTSEIPFADEKDLISKLRPSVDGLILTESRNRGAFLPVMWDHFPDPRVFLMHLKRKAGLPVDYWSDTIRVDRFITECEVHQENAFD